MFTQNRRRVFYFAPIMAHLGRSSGFLSSIPILWWPMHPTYNFDNFQRRRTLALIDSVWHTRTWSSSSSNAIWSMLLARRTIEWAQKTTNRLGYHDKDHSIASWTSLNLYYQRYNLGFRPEFPLMISEFGLWRVRLFCLLQNGQRPFKKASNLFSSDAVRC